MEIKSTNTINNIKVTVEYDMQEDLELAMALKKLSETKTNYKTTDNFYTPKINAIGEAKSTQPTTHLCVPPGHKRYGAAL